MLAELKKVAGDFESQPLTRGREMRDLLERSREDFCTAALEILAGEDADRVKRYLVALLGTNNLLIPCLTDPSVPGEKAESIAALARRVDPQLPSKLVSYLLERTDLEPPECLERILALLKAMPDAASFRPMLTPLLRHENPRIRAKVALLAGTGNRNRTWFERRMLEDDPRVRANAIESADTGIAEELRPMFRAAVSDSNNRVVGNALVALYRLGEAQAVAKLYELASRPEPEFRATAVWAMAETGDTRFLPVLARIVTDPNETIKPATFRAIRKLRSQENAGTQPVKVTILGEPATAESNLRIAFGVSDEGKPVSGLPATAVRVCINGRPVYHYDVTELDCRRRISAGFLLPRTANLRREGVELYREALDRSFEQRVTGDAWLLSVYSTSRVEETGGRHETLFGVRIDSTVDNASVRSIEDSEEIRVALDSCELAAQPGFTSGFLSMCRQLRPSRVSSHLFLLHPENLSTIDPAALARAAREDHVSVHAVCIGHEPRIRKICRDTGGFYIVGENIPEILPQLYHGITQRYQLNINSPGEVRQAQVAVRSAEISGESAIVDIKPDLAA